MIASSKESIMITSYSYVSNISPPDPKSLKKNSSNPPSWGGRGRGASRGGGGIHPLPSKRKVSLKRPFAPKMSNKGLKWPKMYPQDTYPLPCPHLRCATEEMKMSDITRKGIVKKILENGGRKLIERVLSKKGGLISLHNVGLYQNVYQ